MGKVIKNKVKKLKHRKIKVKGAKRFYITRRKAIQKLQMSLKDFRRICILKGVYPVEPERKKDGICTKKTYFLLSDIRWLSHEPIIWKFWDYKIFLRRLTRAERKKDSTSAEALRENVPFYKLDHIVKERYPTFIDALRDIDDALSMCFLISNIAKIKGIPKEMIDISRRLTIEWMCYVIESKSLRNVFISIKGYYYQAEVMGQLITWLVPHQFVLTTAQGIDFKIVRSFTEFYITLLGFINFKLYSSLSLYYPPKINYNLSQDDEKCIRGDDEDFARYELISALNKPLVSMKSKEDEDEVKLDVFEENEEEDEDSQKAEKNFTLNQLVKLQNLFNGLKFYVCREVPREAVVFVIRCFGGEVSWDKTCFVGATFEESDETITHQIVDREHISNKYMNRYYIQPQWVFDCVNARRLLPVENYFQGVTLPPHLSPFVKEEEGDYVPSEKSLLFGERRAYESEESENEEDKEEQEQMVEEDEEECCYKSDNLNMKVKTGRVEKVNKKRKAEMEEAEQKRLAVMMIPKKKKRLYDRIMYGKRRKLRMSEKLKSKREQYVKEIASRTNNNDQDRSNDEKVKRKAKQDGQAKNKRQRN